MVLNACYNGIGRTVGSVLAGKLKDRIGTAHMFAVFGFIDVGTSLLLASYLFLNDCPTLDRQATSQVLGKEKLQ
jgi:predicted MFS family arabinose efflux permease